MHGLLWFISLGLVAGLALFSVVFRRVRTELQAARNRGVPVAVISRYGGGLEERGGRGSLAARLAGAMPAVQAAIVAMAAMSIFIMALCLVACMVLAVRGS